MKKTVLFVVLTMFAFSALAGDFDTQSVTNADGVQHWIPVTEQKCQYQNKANVGNAAIGAGVGYATSRILTGKKDSAWNWAGLAAGALIGANTQKSQDCRMVEVLTGHKVISVSKDGKLTEEFRPYVGPEKIKQ